jgi:hypothetical protein
MATDLERAYTTINNKRPAHDLRWQYYEGEAPLKFSTERLRQAFESFSVYFAQNWLGVVVSSVLDRLTLKGFSIPDTTANAKLEEIFTNSNLQLTAFDTHEAGLVTGEAYVIAERDEDGEVTCYYNDPRLCHVFYEADRPKVKAFAAKMWFDEGSDTKRLALYYPDRTEFWQAGKNTSTARAFTLVTTEPNDTNTIPVFHFRNTRRGKGEFGKADASIQDAVNKLFSDLMVAAEFTSIKQRVFIGNADPGDVKTFEDIWYPDKDGKVQEVGGADLDNFLNAIDKLASALGAITRTPKHFFYAQGGDPSGEALIALEAPLVRKTLQRQENNAVTWRELAAYLLELDGVTVAPTAITPIWQPVTTLQPLTGAQILQTETSAGVPLKVSAKRQGWAEDEVKQLGNTGADPDKSIPTERDARKEQTS